MIEAKQKDLAIFKLRKDMGGEITTWKI
jgi:hypothetical protein